MATNEKFGIASALATPFAGDGSIETDVLVRHIKRCLSGGCDRVALFGTTGEGPSISAAERLKVIDFLHHSKIDMDRVIMAVITPSIEDAVEQCRVALLAGSYGLLVAPPYYFKGVDELGIENWYAALLNALGKQARNVILYNIPSLTGVALSVGLVGRLKQGFAAIMAVKDSSGDWDHTTSCLIAAHRDLAILIGDERDLARGLRAGGGGAISGMANVYPGILATIMRTQEDSAYLSKIVSRIVQLPITPAIKFMLAELTGEEVWKIARPPLTTLDTDRVAALREVCDELK